MALRGNEPVVTETTTSLPVLGPWKTFHGMTPFDISCEIHYYLSGLTFGYDTSPQ